MNVSLLEDENYLEELLIDIPKWKQEGEIDLSDKRCVWDWIKYNIRLHAISYSKEKPNLNMRKSSGFNKNLKWLNTVWQFVSVCHLPNHGKRKVAAHQLKLGS